MKTNKTKDRLTLRLVEDFSRKSRENRHVFEIIFFETEIFQ